MMVTVTEIEGTGKAAAVEGYRVAGKTGTAQRFTDGRFDTDSHNVWFVGDCAGLQTEIGYGGCRK